MTVSLDAETISEETIRQAVARTGMEAIPWQETGATHGEEETFWQRHERTIMCSTGGILLLTGFLWHALRHSSLLDALATGDSSRGRVFPLGSILLYFGAVVSGAWFVAPKALYAARTLRPT